MKTSVARVVATAVTTLFAFGLSACGGGSQGNAGDTLVAETTFNLQTIDPHRQFEFTGSTIDDAVYQTALTFKDGDLSQPAPGLCDFEMNDDNTELTLTLLDSGAKFSDGSDVEVDDIVFSYERLKGIGGNPSFFLDGVEIEKVDDKTIKLKSETPKPELPFMLPNSSLGIVNADVVKENGGTTGEDDKAQEFLDQNPQGSGPYTVDSYKPDSEVVLVANEHYNGEAPKYKRVVLRNVSAETQLTDIQSGQAQVAYDINQDQVNTLGDGAAQVESIPSTYSLYIFNNQDSSINEFTAKPEFREAVSLAVDYDKILELGGEGSQRLSSLVPNQFAGAVPNDQAPQRDLEKAKELLSKAGYNGEEIPFHYASDQTLSGVSLGQLGESLQAQLKEAGINLSLNPAPASTQLDGFRSGKQPMGIGTWGADYPDPQNYEVFLPGGTVAERVNWSDADSELDSLIKRAQQASGDDRSTAYSDVYSYVSDNGPWVPLIQPAQTMVIANSVTSYVSNADTRFDFAAAK